jgi:hypothetical protein
MAWNDGSQHALGGFNMAQAMVGQQGSHLAGMINQAQDAWQKEHDSRVAQERERRRMEHEKEMMRMQAVAQRQPMVDEGAIIRSLLMG